MMQQPMERVIIMENLVSQEEVKTIEGNKGLMTREEPLKMGKRPITTVSKLIIIERQIQKEVKKRKGSLIG